MVLMNCGALHALREDSGRAPRSRGCDMWTSYCRDRSLEQLSEPFDIIVVGGGITGAGVLREAARMGLRCCLLEGRDFAWGTSSWSSKMVHGGLRYLTDGDVRLTLEAVRERNRLLREAPDLITPLSFLFAFFRGQEKEKYLLQVALMVYDILAFQWRHGSLPPKEQLQRVPLLRAKDLISGLYFQDALTDDSRLVMAVLREALKDGGTALNYCSVQELIREDDGIRGVRALDRIRGETREVRGRAVINATGAWAERLCCEAGDSLSLRPLRGSHLVLPASKLSLSCAVTFMHPEDRRPVFVFPWGSVTVAGTTDLDHEADMDRPPVMSARERDYLLTGLRWAFPSLSIAGGDVISTYSGIRPVVGHREDDPSKESRKHVVRDRRRLITVTGGKLTTFRLLARDALKQAEKYLGPMQGLKRNPPVFTGQPASVSGGHGLSRGLLDRLSGILGRELPEFLDEMPEHELAFVGGSETLWAELRWSLRHEGVCHLEDLMLRRSRLGLVLSRGGVEYLGDILGLCCQELGWDETRAEGERARYLRLWQECYSPQPWSPQDAYT